MSQQQNKNETQSNGMPNGSANGASRPVTVIGAGTRVVGELNIESGARIVGSVEGKLNAGGEIQIDKGASARAQINAASVLIEGSVEGDVIASERLELSGDAKVLGDLTARSLVVAEGASFSGHCRVGSDVDLKDLEPARMGGRLGEMDREPGIAEMKQRERDLNMESRENEHELSINGSHDND